MGPRALAMLVLTCRLCAAKLAPNQHNDPLPLPDPLGLHHHDPLNHHPRTYASALTHVAFVFHARQTDAALANLRSWDAQYPPCPQHKCAVLPPTKVLFYVGYSADDDIAGVQDKVAAAWNELACRCCFGGGMLYKDVRLDARDDSYINGARLMFEHVVCGQLDAGMRKVLLMEPDMRPVRPHWLLKLHAEARHGDVFWVKGSVYRGNSSHLVSSSRVREYRPAYTHINGNALYSLGDSGFCEFYRRVRQYVVAKHGDSYAAYDTDMAEYLMDSANWDAARHHFHRFVFTDVIQNMWHTDYSLLDMVSAHPNTYLVHGGRQV